MFDVCRGVCLNWDTGFGMPIWGVLITVSRINYNNFKTILSKKCLNNFPLLLLFDWTMISQIDWLVQEINFGTFYANSKTYNNRYLSTQWIHKGTFQVGIIQVYIMLLSPIHDIRVVCVLPPVTANLLNGLTYNFINKRVHMNSSLSLMDFYIMTSET